MISFELKPRLNQELLDNFFNDTTASMAETRIYTTKTKIVEKDNEFFILVELPGVKKDDVKVLIENNVLTISGVKKSLLDDDEKSNVIINQTITGKFTRRFNLNDGIDSQTITAKFENGNLIINLKKNEVKSEKKEIKVL